MAAAAMRHDLAVIGAGAAGLSVASAAAQLGQEVVLFEKAEMGGECLNTGCIPSKALLAAAGAAQAHRASAPFGVGADEPVIDFAKVMDHVERAISRIAPQDSQARFEGLGVKVVRAHARFTGRTTLSAGGEHFSARRIVIATGSRPKIPAIPGLAETPFFTSDTIFRNRVLPRHLIIIGGGPVGMEMAQAFRRLGSQVTVLEAAAPLASEDAELAGMVLQQFRTEGIAVLAPVKITSVACPETEIEVQLDGMAPLSGSHLLVAAGRTPNLGGLELENAGIATDAHGIKLDRALRSVTNRHVYVAGDAASGPQFTHAAVYHAGLIIRNALFRLPVRYRADVVPRVTFTDPELAQAGLTEVEARAAHGHAIKVLRCPFAENDRAVAEGSDRGLVKIVVLKSGRIVGASIVAGNAGEQIALWSLAVSRKLRISEIAGLVLPYPTMAEAGKRAAMGYFAGFAGLPWLRKIIGFLGIFG